MLIHYLLLLSVVILSNHDLVQAATYDDAECNGFTIVAIRDDRSSSSNNAIKLELGTATPFTIPIINSAPPWQISATAIEPCSLTVYTLIFGAVGVDDYHLVWKLATLSDPFSIENAAIFAGPDISGLEYGKLLVPAMAFNNEGTLFIIDLTQQIFELDTTTGISVLRDTRTQTTGDSCSPFSGSPTCHEALGFNWDNGLFYRISSSITNTNIMECFEINELGGSDPGMLLTLTDTDMLCDEKVHELTYIGNFLWLIACDSTIRLLDTSGGSTAVITPVGTNGITQRGGGGLIASINENGVVELCDVQCPTSSPTEYPTQPSQNHYALIGEDISSSPTEYPTQPSQNHYALIGEDMSSDDDSFDTDYALIGEDISSDDDSFDNDYALIGEDVEDDNDNNLNEMNKNVVINFSESSIYQLSAIVILIVCMIVIGVLYCHYSHQN